MQYQLIQLKKDGSQHELYYENDEDSFNIPLEQDDYVKIFQKIEPNFAFSTPDKMIQDHIKDGSIMPTFKNGNLFNNEDMMQIMEKAKKEMNFIMEMNSSNDKDKKKKLKNKTKKNIKKKDVNKRKKRQNAKQNNIKSKDQKAKAKDQKAKAKDQKAKAKAKTQKAKTPKNKK